MRDTAVPGGDAAGHRGSLGPDQEIQEASEFRTDLPADWQVTCFYTLLHAAGDDVPAGRVDQATALDALTMAGGSAFAPATRSEVVGIDGVLAIAVVNTVISLYYYLRVIAPTVLDHPPAPETATPVGPSHVALTAALGITGLATVAFGLAAEPLLRLAERATVLT